MIGERMPRTAGAAGRDERMLSDAAGYEAQELRVLSAVAGFAAPELRMLSTSAASIEDSGRRSSESPQFVRGAAA